MRLPDAHRPGQRAFPSRGHQTVAVQRLQRVRDEGEGLAAQQVPGTGPYPIFAMESVFSRKLWALLNPEKIY